MTTTTADLGTVEGYVAGRWSAPTGLLALLADAATGEAFTQVATGPVDAAAAVEHARRVGSPALHELGFHERAMILKQLAQHLTARKPALHELSARTGATSRDSLVDVDGGIGVLFSYGSRGRRELPAGNVLLDGPAEALSRGGQFVGQHVLTARRGVAVQVNAFNFPVWGALEELAPAFPAGVPTAGPRRCGWGACASSTSWGWTPAAGPSCRRCSRSPTTPAARRCTRWRPSGPWPP